MAGEQVVVGLDVGTTKVCTLIGEVKVAGRVRVVGAGVCPSKGLRKGVVVDMEEAAGAIAASVKKAEVFSGYQIMGASVAVSGGRLDSELVSGGLSLSGDRPVSMQDMAEVLEAARAREVVEGRRVLHMIPQGYSVDGENGIHNPEGMMASHLEVGGLVVTASAAPLLNLARCVEHAGIQIDGFVSAGLASAEGVLSAPERQLGVLLMDIGGGTTDLVWFRDGHVRFAGALPVGGNYVTNDISVGFGVPFTSAEEMKLRFAYAVPGDVAADDIVDTGPLSEGQARKVSRRFMSEIVEARVSEIFSLAMEELKRRGFDGILPAGLVLAGGTAQLRGIRELAERTFEMPVRIGVPEGLAGSIESIATPAHATGAGLLKWVLAQTREVAEGTRPIRRRVGMGARLKGLVKAFLP